MVHRFECESRGESVDTSEAGPVGGDRDIPEISPGLVIDWRGMAVGEPDAGVLAALEGVVPADLFPGAVVDAIVAAERVIAHVQGLQAGLLADLARPGRAGDVSRLVQTLVDKGGSERHPPARSIRNWCRPRSMRRHGPWRLLRWRLRCASRIEPRPVGSIERSSWSTICR